MNNLEFVKRLKDIATNYKTLYVMGCFGAPLTDQNKERYCKNNEYNMQASRQKMIRAASADTFGFDCSCFLKSVLWGWNGDKSKTYGGAKYASNSVPDIGANSMIAKCKDVSTDFSKIEIGEALWLSGHIGVYIGDGLAVECTPVWKNGVQITAVQNIGTKSGYNARKWTKHGYLPYITYKKEMSTATSTEMSTAGYKAGKAIQLKNEKLYISSTVSTANKTVSGTYYISDGKVVNGRIRITTSKSLVGIMDSVTGWIKAPAMSFNNGEIVKLNKTPIFVSAVAKTANGKKTGTFFVWDKEIINGRIRITNKYANVGIEGQVTGWVNASEI